MSHDPARALVCLPAFHALRALRALRALCGSLLAAGLLAACAAPEPVPDGWIDRIEGDVAVVVVEEGGRYREAVVPVALLPPGASEGDALRDGRLDHLARDALRARIDALQRHLRRGDDDPPLGASPAGQEGHE